MLTSVIIISGIAGPVISPRGKASNNNIAKFLDKFLIFYIPFYKSGILVIIEKNPRLENEEGENLKNLLYLFERDIAIKTLMAG